MISAKLVGSVLGEAAAKKVLGKENVELIHTGIFAARLARALTVIKNKEGRLLADEVAEAVRQAVPVGETGELRDSVRVEPRNDGTFLVIVGGTPATMKVFREGNVTFDLALGIEFGTTRMPAQPFFWPTVRRYEKRIERSLGAAIEKELS